MVLQVEQNLDPQAEAKVPTVAVKAFIPKKLTREMNLKLLDALGNCLQKKKKNHRKGNTGKHDSENS